MGVVRAKERPDRRQAVQDKEGKWSYQRTWLVVVDSTGDGANVVLSAPDLPKLRYGYQTANERNDDAIVVRRTPRQLRKTKYHYEVDIEYETRSPEEQERNPLLRATKFLGWDYQVRCVPVSGTLKTTVVITPATTAPYKRPARNSLHQVFPTQPMRERYDGVGTWEQNREAIAFSGAWCQEWTDVVNEDDFQGAEPGQLRLVVRAGAETRETVDDEEIVYVPVQFVIEYKADGHKERILDEGPMYRTSTSSTALRSFVDENGRPYVGLLDGKGRPLQCNPGFETSTFSTHSSTVLGVFLLEEPHRQKTFAELNLF